MDGAVVMPILMNIHLENDITYREKSVPVALSSSGTDSDQN